MTDKERMARIERYASIIQKQTGKAVRPYRADGYANVLNKYGTSKDSTEYYSFVSDEEVPDDTLARHYEQNGLFSKIIDAPAEEAVKHGFTLKDVSDTQTVEFFEAALDELDWEETAINCLKWSRLFGGAIAVLLVNDDRGLAEPLDWKNIKSIDDIRVYDRSCVQPDAASMFSYDPSTPFGTRGSRLGMPEHYNVTSKYGSFRVHESRCLVFQNCALPEKTPSSTYGFWGIPEYVRISRAMRDAEVAHGSAVKMLDRSVQPVYKMRDLSMELGTDEGENRVLKRLQTIDMARGLLNTIAIDSEGEDYDFRTFQFSGVSNVISASCNFLSALTSIPQAILFGQSDGAFSNGNHGSFETYYSYVERIQKRMVRSNLRYLLSVIFQAGLATGEINEVPSINIEFNPLWTMDEGERADVELKKVQISQAKSQVATAYASLQALSALEIRKSIIKNGDFEIASTFEDDDEEKKEEIDEKLHENGGLAPDGGQDDGGGMAPPGGGQITEQGALSQFAKEPDEERGAPEAAPTATKLPQDMSQQEKETAQKEMEEDSSEESPEESYGSVGVIVTRGGKILTGIRMGSSGTSQICGPGGHIEKGESPEMAAAREANEEFGIFLNELIPLGRGRREADTGLTPYIFLCDDFDGTPKADDREMTGAEFLSLEELEQRKKHLFKPFAYSLHKLKKILSEQLDTQEDSIKNTKNQDNDKGFIDNPQKCGIINRDEGDGLKWITLPNGVHVQVDKDGNMVVAPEPLKGKNVKDIQNESAPKKRRVPKSGTMAAKDHVLNGSTPAAQAAYDKARKAEKGITKDLVASAESSGASMHGLEFSVKTASSVMDKVERKKFKNPNLTDEEIVSSMGDIVRYTMESEHSKIGTTAQKAISDLKAKGYELIEVDNKWTRQGDNVDYRGLHTSFKSPDGQIFELQFHSPESMEVKNYNHKLYEEFRKPSCSEGRKKELMREMVEKTATLPMPDSIEQIKSFKKG